MKIFKLISAASLALIFAGIGSTASPSPIQDDRIKQALLRVNLSGRQRMLSQRIAGLSCLVYLDIEATPHSREVLESRNLFEQTLTLLGAGSVDSGLARENSPKVLDGIKKAQAQITNISDLLAPLANDEPMEQSRLGEILVASGALFYESDQLTSYIQAVHGEHLQNLSMLDTIIINFAGRQRMLSEKAFKEFCFVQAGVQTDANLENLAQTVLIFDNTMNALINGMPGVIIAPPSDEVKEKLEEVRTVWLPVEGMLQRALAGEIFDNTTILLISNELEKVRKLMNEAVTLYQSIDRDPS